MIGSYGRLISLVAGLVLLSAAAASACEVGDVQCDNGYRYVCACWTTTGCNYERSGICHHDDGTGPATRNDLDRLMDKYVRHASLVSGRSRANLAVEAGALN